MSSYFDTMQVCRNLGHKITDCFDRFPNHRQDHCHKCGSETINACEFCQAKIKGYYHVDNVIGGSGPNVPLFCHKCGKPYPWKNVLYAKNIAHAFVLPAKYIVDSIIGIFKK